MARQPDGGWLDETESRAWQGLLALAMLVLPEIERGHRRYGLVGVEYAVLVALSEKVFRLSDLAAALKMSQSRLSHRMSKLISRGLVIVRPCPGDGRASLAEITPCGRALLEELAPRHVEDVRRLIFNHLDHAQVAALADALGSVVSGLVACPDGNAPC
ncbi:MarR family winged helix-turn-helix transcriptional regulator [Planotetraspora sp. GP83]|uniref:MarR family winged helix-turn-helix transcriptional regulator n=1 Tax=Planotetraspora sp. GP83 TaxID=3156264 RepID=UPI0035112BCC